MQTSRCRIYLTGVGGQGTLTATTLLAKTALASGLEVVSGEIHGMAQRGGVVESTILLGGWKSSKIGLGEADIILGFEPLETLRGLAYLRPQGIVFSSTDMLPPPGVTAGLVPYPEMDALRATVQAAASAVYFLPCRALGQKAGSVQSGNTVLLAALCASGLVPIDIRALEDGIRRFLPPKLVDVNLTAAQIGSQFVSGKN